MQRGGGLQLSHGSPKVAHLSSLGASAELSIGDGRPSTAPFKTEAERRRHQLDKKRSELVEARLGRPRLEPHSGGGEPLNPVAMGGSPDVRLGFTQPLAVVSTPSKDRPNASPSVLSGGMN